MPKEIKVRVNPYAQASDITAASVQASIDSTLRAAGAKSTGATIIRDAQGKVVEVIVGVPDHVADGTVGNAANALLATKGVSTIRTTLSPPFEALRITNITPNLAGLTNDPATGWSFYGFVGIIDYAVIAAALNNTGGGVVKDAWNYGNPYNPMESLSIKRPVIFNVINWGRFLTESGFGSNFPGFVDGDTTFAGGVFTLTYDDGIVTDNTITVTLPAVSVPASTPIKYPGFNQFTDMQRCTIFYIDQFGRAKEIADTAEAKSLYGLV